VWRSTTDIETQPSENPTGEADIVAKIAAPAAPAEPRC
jgi:hypothetical protein